MTSLMAQLEDGEVCPVLRTFIKSWKRDLDNLGSALLLYPLTNRPIGKRGSEGLQGRRAIMAVDWYFRVYTPAWLRLSGLNDCPRNLANHPEITLLETLPSMQEGMGWAPRNRLNGPSLQRYSGQKAARNAMRLAGGSAVKMAVTHARRPGEWRESLRDAAYVAETAAANAAQWVPWTDSPTTAMAAAEATLRKTTAELQRSAVNLIVRMSELTDEAHPPKKQATR